MNKVVIGLLILAATSLTVPTTGFSYAQSYPEIICTMATFNDKGETVYQRSELTHGGHGIVQEIYREEGKWPFYWEQGDYYLEAIGSVNWNGNEKVSLSVQKTSRDFEGGHSENYKVETVAAEVEKNIGEGIKMRLENEKLTLTYACVKL